MTLWLPLALLAFGCSEAAGQVADGHDKEVITVPEVPDTGPRADVARAAKTVIDRTNQFRAQEGLKPVTTNAELTAAAGDFAGYMARTDEYGHTADGSRPADRAFRHGYEYCIVLENIAYAFDSRGFVDGKLADQFVTGWQNSPGHRKNMLDPDVTQTGVAVVRSDKTGHYYAVQMFGRPRSAAVEFRIDNRSGADIGYAIGDEKFALPPRYVRTHTRCRPAALTFHWPGEQSEPATVRPAAGDRLVVTRDGGEFRVRKE